MGRMWEDGTERTDMFVLWAQWYIIIARQLLEDSFSRDSLLLPSAVIRHLTEVSMGGNHNPHVCSAIHSPHGHSNELICQGSCWKYGR